MKYPKINSLWKRQAWYFDENKKKYPEYPEYQKGRQSFIVGDYSFPAFGNIKHWLVDEKIDGTNIRIFFDNSTLISDPKVHFGGRIYDAQIPCHLLDFLQDTFTKERMVDTFNTANNVILFGEGYGPKIQAAGPYYRADVSVILFDIWIDGFWLTRDSVKEIARTLQLSTVPEFGVMKEEDIVNLVKSKPLSLCSIKPQTIEGVVCRSEPLLLDRHKQPLMWKLKCKEFM